MDETAGPPPATPRRHRLGLDVVVHVSLDGMLLCAHAQVAWFTQGGMVDECGVRHTSNLHYKWELLSVLNEDEYNTPPGGGVEYTICSVTARTRA